MLRGLILLGFVLFVCACNEQSPAQNAQGANILSILTQDGARHDFTVELALTPSQIERGLMHRTDLPENAGMLFWFGDEAERGFWMKNTLLPLDMLFIRRDGTIHHIHKRAKPHDLTSILSRGPVAAVLEVNGGRAEALGIRPGDTIHHVLFGNSLAPDAPVQ